MSDNPYGEITAAQDGRSTPDIPPTSRIMSIEYSLVRIIDPASSGDPIVLCRGLDGVCRYATLSEWRAGSRYLELGSLPPSCAAATLATVVTTHSSNRDKLALFRLLFAGRDDVHAESYHDKKRNHISYSPACANFWKRGTCPKCVNRSARCAICENRAFTPLTDRLVIGHMKGDTRLDRGVIGIYPLVDNDKTHFLVVDFDGFGWQQAVSTFISVCKGFNLPVAIERSRSGDGAHAWFFFSELVDAAMARKMGAALLTRAMRRTGRISFDCYDRMLPNQDSAPKGGFGNLIALPFQGAAMEQGNTLFVDELFNAYRDQWTYLACLPRMTGSDIEAVLAKLGKHELGVLPKIGEESTDKKDEALAVSPWQSRLDVGLGQQDVPESIELVRANGVYIPKAGLSAAALDALRRLAAMANPQFYKKQAMRQSVYGTPRLLHFEYETDGWLRLPRACEAQAVATLASCGSKVVVKDERYGGRLIKVTFNGTLKDEQARIVDEMCVQEDGIIVAETGFGKTVVAAGIIARLKVNTLIVVPTTALLSQWRDRLTEFLEIDEEPPIHLTQKGRKSRRQMSVIGTIGGGRKMPSGIVDIALVGSLFEKGDVEGTHLVSDTVKGYGLVIVDECHHAAAPNYTEVLSEVCSRYLFGMTATPKRSDGLQGIMHFLLGPIRYKAVAQNRSYSRLLCPRFTKTRLDADATSDFVKVIDHVCTDDARTALIVDDVANAWKGGRTSLVLTRRIEHAEALSTAIAKKGCPTQLLTGGGSAKERREKLKNLSSFSPGAPFVLVGTDSYLGEGFDEKRLDTLFVAAPVAFEGLVAQCVGRIQRDCEGKTDVVVYDYVDESIQMLDRMFRRRLKEYGRLGYTIGASAANDIRGEFIGRESYLRRLDADIRNSEESIVIASSDIHLKRLDTVLNLLNDAKKQGRKVTVRLRNPNPDNARNAQRAEQALDACRRAGVDTRLVNNCPNLVVLDGRTAWYGGLAPLAFPREGEQALRLTDSAIAHDLVLALLRETMDTELTAV